MSDKNTIDLLMEISADDEYTPRASSDEDMPITDDTTEDLGSHRCP